MIANTTLSEASTNHQNLQNKAVFKLAIKYQTQANALANLIMRNSSNSARITRFIRNVTECSSTYMPSIICAQLATNYRN